MGDDLEVEVPVRASPLRIAGRVVLVVGALAISFVVLRAVFDDLDPAEIGASLRSLDDAEIISLLSMWLLWIAAQGLQTASLVPGLPVRRGVVAFLGPAAVASLVPGPSDLPVRYRMITSWGRDRGEATLAVGAGGLFSIGIKLVLPVIAAVGLVVSDAPIDGTLRTIVVITLVIGAVLVAIAVVLGSEPRTERLGRLLGPVWRLVLRLMRRPDPPDFATRLVEARARSLDLLHDRWPIAIWGTCLTAGARFALLLMAVRFTGIGDDVLSWSQVFVVYAVVQGLTVLPLTAGDAGVSEVALIGLLTASAGGEWVNQVTAGVIVFRLLTWLAIIPVGLGAIAVWRRALRTGDQSTGDVGRPVPDRVDSSPSEVTQVDQQDGDGEGGEQGGHDLPPLAEHSLQAGDGDERPDDHGDHRDGEGDEAPASDGLDGEKDHGEGGDADDDAETLVQEQPGRGEEEQR